MFYSYDALCLFVLKKLEYEIPLIVVISPYAGISEELQRIYNTASDIAVEYNVEFLNCNLLNNEIGMDYSVDVADDGYAIVR